MEQERPIAALYFSNLPLKFADWDSIVTRPAEIAGYHGLMMYIVTVVRKPIHKRPANGEVQGRIVFVEQLVETKNTGRKECEALQEILV